MFHLATPHSSYPDEVCILAIHILWFSARLSKWPAIPFPSVQTLMQAEPGLGDLLLLLKWSLSQCQRQNKRPHTPTVCPGTAEAGHLHRPAPELFLTLVAADILLTVLTCTSPGPRAQPLIRSKRLPDKCTDSLLEP